MDDEDIVAEVNLAMQKEPSVFLQLRTPAFLEKNGEEDALTVAVVRDDEYDLDATPITVDQCEEIVAAQSRIVYQLDDDWISHEEFMAALAVNFP